MNGTAVEDIVFESEIFQRVVYLAVKFGMKLKGQDQVFFICAVQGVNLMAVDQKNVPFVEKKRFLFQKDGY